MKSNSKEIIPLPFQVYFLIFFGLALLGVLDAIYLSISHYRVYTDIEYQSFCALTKTINCDTVSQSPYSVFLKLPIPVWGVVGYTFILICLCFFKFKDIKKNNIWAFLTIVTGCYTILSILLAFVSSFYIKSYCIMCIATYGINLLLLFYSGLIRRRFSSVRFVNDLKNDFNLFWRKRKFTLTFLTMFFSLIVIIAGYFPEYWSFRPPLISDKVKTGVTDDGAPWIGAETPEITIAEFADYLCFQCNKTHFFLRQLINRYPQKFRLIHYHFPMDSKVNEIVTEPFHEGAGEMAMLAIHALEKGKFWEMNDALFRIARQKSDIDIQRLAKDLGMDPGAMKMAIHNKRYKQILTKDIWKGMKLRIIGTPAFLIDGKVYLGEIPSEVIRKIID